MLSKRYESTEVDRRTWLHVPSGTHWSTSSDTHQVVEIYKETSTVMYTPLIQRNKSEWCNFFLGVYNVQINLLRFISWDYFQMRVITIVLR